MLRRHLNSHYKPQKKLHLVSESEQRLEISEDQDAKTEFKYRSETSSDSRRNVQYAVLQWPDGMLTIPRWFHLGIDLAKRNGLHPTSQGPLIDYTAQHHPFTFMLISTLTIMSAAAGLDCWKEENYNREVLHEKNKAKHERNYQLIQDEFQKKLRESELNEDEFIANLNKKIRDTDHQTENEKKFFAKFKNATIIKDKHNKIVVDFSTEFKPINSSLALLDTSFLSAFYYWDAWIIMVCATGLWVAGIPLCSLSVSFILPVSIACIGYLAPKAYHWAKHKFFNPERIKTAEEEVNADSLLEYVLKMKTDFDVPVKTGNETLFKFHAVAVGLVSGILKSQYILWIFSDRFSCLLNFTNELGCVSLLLGCLLSYKAYCDKYNEIENTINLKDNSDLGDDLLLLSENDFADEKNRTQPILVKNNDNTYSLWGYKKGEWQLTLLNDFTPPIEWGDKTKVHVSPETDIFETLKVGHSFKNIDLLKEEIKQLKQKLNDYHEEHENQLVLYFEKLGKDERAFVNTLGYLAYDYSMTAAFIARICVIANVTSPFVPAFLHLASLAAVLSNPASLAIIALTSITWAGFRCYVRHQENVEKDLLEEKIKNTPQKYEHLAAEKIVLQKRVDNIKSTVSFIPRFGLSRLGIFSTCCAKESSNIIEGSPSSTLNFKHK